MGPYTWTLADNTLLPDGLFLGRGTTPANTSIVGKPTLTGIYPFHIKVTDSLEKEIIDSAREHLAPYKLPKSLRIISEMPKSPVGKILRRALRGDAPDDSLAQPGQPFDWRHFAFSRIAFGETEHLRIIN